MKNFTLAVYAKRRSDGNYEYSLKVWENPSTGFLSGAINFDSRTLTNQLDAAWPVRGDANLIGSDIESAGDYWYRFTMPMSDEQAANLGWRSASARDGLPVN